MMILCQSCGMPLQTDEDKGRNKDNSLSNDYCTFCFREGEFTQDLTMDEMIEHCAQFVDEFNKDQTEAISKAEAIVGMKKFFPTLRRWAK